MGRKELTIGDTTMNEETCTSCDKEFIAEDWNDKDCGWFCDECLENDE